MIFWISPQGVSGDDPVVAPEIQVAILAAVGAVVGLILDYLIGG